MRGEGGGMEEEGEKVEKEVKEGEEEGWRWVAVTME